MVNHEYQYLAKKFKSQFLHSLKPIRFEVKSMIGRFIYPKKNKPSNLLIHIGCGQNILEGFDNIDFYDFKIFGSNLIGHDLRFPLPFEDDSYEGALSEHTLEHLYPRDAVNLLKEIRRILKKGSIFRIVVPNLKAYVNFYNGIIPNSEFNKFENGCEAIWNLTQNWGHISCWDSKMLISQLINAGFTSAYEMAYLEGANKRLLKDSPNRQWESLYIEAIA